MHGGYVLGCEALRRLESDLLFWLQPHSLDICKVRCLQRDGLWKADFDIFSDADRVRTHLFAANKMNDWARWREFKHDEYFSEEQLMHASHVLVIHSRDADDVANEATQLLPASWRVLGDAVAEAAAPISTAGSVEPAAAAILTARSDANP